MEIRRITAIAGLTALVFTTALPVYAAPRGQDKKTERAELREDIRNKIQDRIKDIREKSATKSGIVNQMLKLKTAVIRGTISAVGADSLTVKQDSKEYTIVVDGKTAIRYRFWGKGQLSQMKAGDSVIVIGKWSDDTRTTVAARLVRDLSVQRRFGVFFGKVSQITSTGWVIDTKNRGVQTVTLTPSSRIFSRQEKPITSGDVQVGHWIRVKGTWDMQAKTIQDVIHVKDYSLPVKPAVTGAATPSATPASIATSPTVSPTPSPTVQPSPTPSLQPSPSASPSPTAGAI